MPAETPIGDTTHEGIEQEKLEGHLISATGSGKSADNRQDSMNRRLTISSARMPPFTGGGAAKGSRLRRPLKGLK